MQGLGIGISFRELPEPPACGRPPNNVEDDYDLGQCRPYKFSPDVRNIQFMFTNCGNQDDKPHASLVLYSFKQEHVGTVCLKTPDVYSVKYHHERDLAAERDISTEHVLVHFSMNLAEIPIGIAYGVLIITASDLSQTPLVTLDLLNMGAESHIRRKIGHRNIGGLTGPSAVVGVLCRNGAWWDLHSHNVPMSWAKTADEFVSNTNGVVPFLKQPNFVVNLPKKRRILFWVSHGVNLAIMDTPICNSIFCGLKICGAGSSDPYYDLTYKAVSRRSPTVKQTLNPEWDLSDIGVVEDKVYGSETAKVHLNMWDSDWHAEPDFLGCIEFKASQLWALLPPDETRCEQTLRLPLKSKPEKYPNSRATGHVVLHVTVEAVDHPADLELDSTQWT